MKKGQIDSFKAMLQAAHGSQSPVRFIVERIAGIIEASTVGFDKAAFYRECGYEYLATEYEQRLAQIYGEKKS